MRYIHRTSLRVSYSGGGGMGAGRSGLPGRRVVILWYGSVKWWRPVTQLAPEVLEAIVDGRQPTELGVHVLREGFPVEWGEQTAALAV
jgi:hypothetical protein